jgi:hypothetical protein
MSPEDNIRMLIGLDGTPVPQVMPPRLPPHPAPVRLPPMYAGGMAYTGQGDPEASTPATHPDEWERGVTMTPPRKAELVAAALQKRRAMGR